MSNKKTQTQSAFDRAFLTRAVTAGQLILVRHGQQVWPDPENSVSQDWVDPPLSELGRRQAELVGQYLSSERIDALYSSELSRAADTGAAIGKHHAMEPTRIGDLDEYRMFRDVDSQSRPADVLGELATKGAGERFVQTRSWDAYPMSESSLEFRRRIGHSIEGIMAHHPQETVVIACHGGVINIVMAQILGLTVDFFFRASHASVHRLRFDEGRRVIESLNESKFLEEADALSV